MSAPGSKFPPDYTIDLRCAVISRDRVPGMRQFINRDHLGKSVNHNSFSGHASYASGSSGMGGRPLLTR